MIVKRGVKIMIVYDFLVKIIIGEEKLLKDYKGKVFFIVNVVSKCGFIL